MTKHKRREPPEERGGVIHRQYEQRIDYRFAGPPPFHEVYEKKAGYLDLVYRWDEEYGLFFQCKTCRRPHALLWRDYMLYVQERRRAGDEAESYKVLCVDGGARLQLARPDEQVDGLRVTCLGDIPGDGFKDVLQ